MPSAVIIGLIVIAVVAGTVVSLRTTAKTGMPSKEVLDRASQRSRELEAQEKAEQADRKE
jgi:mannose/fructose/N-acetylgalactosamine-specific phosphotransferase system component IID